MANYSDFECTLRGTEESIKAVHKRLLESTKDDWFYMEPPEGEVNSWGYSGVESPYYNVTENEIYFAGSGRWHGPYGVIEDLAEEFSLSGDYNDFESGCNFYHKMIFADGIKTLDKEYSYMSPESVAHRGIEFMLEEYQWIAEEDGWEEEYSELIESLVSSGVPRDVLMKEYRAVNSQCEPNADKQWLPKVSSSKEIADAIGIPEEESQNE